MLSWRRFTPTSDTSLLITMENDFHIVYPDDYKKVSMQYNKGVPNRMSIMCGNIERVFGRLISIDPCVHPNILDAKKWVADENGLFPFGTDPFGNLFAFKFSTADRYEIVFYDMENGIESSISASFSEFLNNLYE